MLRFGVIGYGGRIRGIISGLRQFDVPFTIAALTDPKGPEYQGKFEDLKDTVLYTDPDEMLDKEHSTAC
jgi:predicted dehydrogenase